MSVVPYYTRYRSKDERGQIANRVRAACERIEAAIGLIAVPVFPPIINTAGVYRMSRDEWDAFRHGAPALYETALASFRVA